MSISRPLRIALISEHASPLATLGSVDAGGQNIYVAHVARCLAQAGHSVDVFTRRDDAALPEVVQMQPRLRVLHMAAGPAHFVRKERLLAYMPAFTSAARHWMARDGGYDVVHANFFMSGLVALRLKDSFGTPVVVTFHALGLVRREHQGDCDAFPGARIDIERRIVAQADRIVAECPQDRSDLMRLYGACDSRIATVPCGVDHAQFAPGDRAAARRRLGLADDDFVVLQLGRMVPRKGVDNVIRALAQLPQAGTARLLVVGGETREPCERATPEIARLRAVAAECGVAERVRFVGQRRRDELADYYGACDVFVTTPWYEPFGITPLEAMACGAPVIGSRVGGIQHTVVDGVTGLLVPPHDPAALAGALAQLRADPRLARDYGRAGMRRARTLYGWTHVAHELADVYDAVRREARHGERIELRPRRAGPGARAAAATLGVH